MPVGSLIVGVVVDEADVVDEVGKLVVNVGSAVSTILGEGKRKEEAEDIGGVTTLPPDMVDDATVTTCTLVRVMTMPPSPACCPSVARAGAFAAGIVASFVVVAIELPLPAKAP